MRLILARPMSAAMALAVWSSLIILWWANAGELADSYGWEAFIAGHWRLLVLAVNIWGGLSIFTSAFIFLPVILLTFGLFVLGLIHQVIFPAWTSSLSLFLSLFCRNMGHICHRKFPRAFCRFPRYPCRRLFTKHRPVSDSIICSAHLLRRSCPAAAALKTAETDVAGWAAIIVAITVDLPFVRSKTIFWAFSGHRGSCNPCFFTSTRLSQRHLPLLGLLLVTYFRFWPWQISSILMTNWRCALLRPIKVLLQHVLLCGSLAFGGSRKNRFLGMGWALIFLSIWTILAVTVWPRG